MPEASEVRLTTEYLQSVLKGKYISSWIFSGGRYTDDPPDGFEEFDEALPLRVDDIECKGKFIYFTLSDEDKQYFIFHSLMMTGRWQVRYDDYCKWFVEYGDSEDSEKLSTLWFRNPRALATLRFTSSQQELTDKLNSLGPDILREEFKLPLFKTLVEQYKGRNITSFLMDQGILSGCGNYIKAEALYYAKISPLRRMSTLTEREIERLYEGVRIIPRLAYNNKGVSLRDYADADGKKGKHSAALKVYGKASAKKTKTPDGRTTYWDPKRQT